MNQIDQYILKAKCLPAPLTLEEVGRLLHSSKERRNYLKSIWALLLFGVVSGIFTLLLIFNTDEKEVPNKIAMIGNYPISISADKKTTSVHQLFDNVPILAKKASLNFSPIISNKNNTLYAPEKEVISVFGSKNDTVSVLKKILDKTQGHGIKDKDVFLFTISPHSTDEDLLRMKVEFEAICKGMSFMYLKKRRKKGKLTRIGFRYEHKIGSKSTSSGKVTLNRTVKFEKIQFGIRLNKEKNFRHFFYKINDGKLKKMTL